MEFPLNASPTMLHKLGSYNRFNNKRLTMSHHKKGETRPSLPQRLVLPLQPCCRLARAAIRYANQHPTSMERVCVEKWVPYRPAGDSRPIRQSESALPRALMQYDVLSPTASRQHGSTTLSKLL